VPSPEEAGQGDRRLEVTLGLLLVGLTAFTIIAFVAPNVGVATVSERLDLVLNTGAMLAAIAVAALAWARYRVSGEARSFYHAGAFTTLASVNAAVLIIHVLNRGAEFGFSMDDPGPLPVIAYVIARFVAAALLVVGGLAAIRQTSLAHRPAVVLVLAPSILTLALLGLIAFGRESIALPITSEGLDHLRRLPGEPMELSMLSAGLVASQLGIGALFAAAAWLAYRTAKRGDRPADAYLSIGLVLAAFSQVHAAVNPGSFAGMVTTADALRIAFYGALLAGVLVQTRTDVRAIGEANAQLRRLRDADVKRALLEERGRLAREVHDGLAQDLWTARLKQGRLAGMLEDGEARELAVEVMETIDTGIADARQAVMAMRAGSTDGPLLEVVQRYVDDFADRFAIEADFGAIGAVPELPARTQAELLRIVQEALNNVRKHADATVVRVRATSENGTFRLVVTDNGRGFEPSRTSDGFGLAGMRERADLIGALLEVASAPRDGTRVAVSLQHTGSGAE
jgi:signal transduction histidine kinase